jgi:hypothetical protein
MEAILATLEEKIKADCFQFPHWQQILYQGFWYGLISWTMTCAEEGKNPADKPITVKELVSHAEPHLESWPLDWLEPTRDAFIALHLNQEQLDDWFSRLDQIFRDCIPTDLDIFSTLGEGATLTEEQWERLYNSLAFLPPDTSAIKPATRLRHKTLRNKGRRALTPMRRHNHKSALTHRHRHPNTKLNIVKVQQSQTQSNPQPPLS